jgi:hypothetical protein
LIHAGGHPQQLFKKVHDVISDHQDPRYKKMYGVLLFMQVASTALDLEGQPTPHKLREEHIDRLRDLLGGGGDNVPGKKDALISFSAT